MISHSFLLRTVLTTLGYTGEIEFGVEPFNFFNRLYELTFLPDGHDELTTIIYGMQGSGADVPLPCTVIPPM